METTDELNIRVSFSRKSVLLPLILFFICWHPGFIGSETLVLTTYYPAPYGGYVSILTTGQTLLARDTGNVGIRTGNTAPRRPLDVNGEIVSSSRITLAQDMTNTSMTWHLDNSGGRFRVFHQPNINTAGTERLSILSANGNVGVNTTAPAEQLHVANGNLRVEDGNINIVRGNLTLTGNGTTTGFITGICYTRTFGTGTSSCLANYRVMATYGTSSCSTGGLLFLGGDLQNPARWRAYVIEGCAGTMLCCRVRDF